MERIKVVHIIPTLDQSGAEKQLTLLAAGLPADRFEVTVCALTRGGYYEERLRAAGVAVHVLGKRFKFDPTTLWRLTRWLRQWQPAIVQTWLFAGNTYGRLAAQWAQVPVIIASERCVDRWKQQYQFAVDRALARRTRAVVVNSQAVAAFYQRVGIPADKLRVIPNAVPPAAAPSTSTRSALLESVGVRTDQPVLGFIGRLWPQKRTQDLIWALDILRISGWNTHLLILGDGPRRAALERFTHSLDLDDRVHFLGHRDDVEDLLPAIDIIVIPSKFEGMPNAALEAMRAGKPVVATRIAGMDEVVVAGETGILVEPKRPFELAKGIHTLLGDPELRARMGNAGRQRAAEVFSIQRMVAAYESLYQELLTGGDAEDYDPAEGPALLATR